MKKFYLLAAALVLLSLLAGCSEKTGGGKIKLEFYNQKAEIPQVFEDLAKKFGEKNPGVEIEVMSPPDSETALFARVSAGNVPDVIHLWPAEPPYKDMMEEGLLLDLTGQEFLKRALPEYLEMSNYKGKSYAMPTTISAFGLWYNKEIFRQYNITVPQTHDELLALCKTLKDQGVQPFAFKDKDTAQEFERMLGIVNPDITSVIEGVADGKTSFTREQDLRILAEEMLEIRQYGQADTTGTGDTQARSDFLGGKAAMFTAGTWMMAQIKDFPNVQMELIPYPNPAEGRPSKMPINIDIAYSIRSGMTEAQTNAALKFIDFLTSPEIAQEFADREGGPCVITGVKQTTPELKVVFEQIGTGNTFLSVLNFWKPGLRAAWVPSVQDLIMTKDVDAFLIASDDLVKTVYRE